MSPVSWSLLGALYRMSCVLGLCLWGYGVLTDVRPVCTHTKCSDKRHPGVRYWGFFTGCPVCSGSLSVGLWCVDRC